MPETAPRGHPRPAGAGQSWDDGQRGRQGRPRGHPRSPVGVQVPARVGAPGLPSCPQGPPLGWSPAPRPLPPAPPAGTPLTWRRGAARAAAGARAAASGAKPWPRRLRGTPGGLGRREVVLGGGRGGSGGAEAERGVSPAPRPPEAGEPAAAASGSPGGTAGSGAHKRTPKKKAKASCVPYFHFTAKAEEEKQRKLPPACSLPARPGGSQNPPRSSW